MRVAIAVHVRDGHRTRSAYETDRRQQLVRVELCTVYIDHDRRAPIDGTGELGRRHDVRFDAVRRQRFAPLLHNLLAFRQQCHAQCHHSSVHGSDEVYTPA